MTIKFTFQSLLAVDLKIEQGNANKNEQQFLEFHFLTLLYAICYFSFPK